MQGPWAPRWEGAGAWHHLIKEQRICLNILERVILKTTQSHSCLPLRPQTGGTAGTDCRHALRELEVKSSCNLSPFSPSSSSSFTVLSSPSSHGTGSPLGMVLFCCWANFCRTELISRLRSRMRRVRAPLDRMGLTMSSFSSSSFSWASKER